MTEFTIKEKANIARARVRDAARAKAKNDARALQRQARVAAKQQRDALRILADKRQQDLVR